MKHTQFNILIIHLCLVQIIKQSVLSHSSELTNHLKKNFVRITNKKIYTTVIITKTTEYQITGI